MREWAGTLADLAGAAGLLGWDRETLMPDGGAEGRARQLGTLAALSHRELVRADAGEALEALADDPSLTADQAAVVRLSRRRRDRAVRLPESLVREISEAGSRGVTAWVAARRAGDFRIYRPALEAVVRLKRREAEALEPDGELYDALLDEYEPATRVRDLEPVFAELRRRLDPLVREASARPAAALPAREWDTDGQVALARDLAQMMGFDMARGVIARSEHPFTSTMHADDVRFTTRVDPASPLSNIGAVMHELGHALYEQGMPAGMLAATPVRDSPSLGAHESQSRFYENHIGLDAGFWTCIEPLMRRRFPEAMAGVDAELLHRASTVVRPSPIRVDADEVTYNLHIILRFELELALVRDDLRVADLPGAFADGMEDLLGIRPADDREGAMQDIHWADGLIGYFPTYTLGNLYAAQLAEAADGDLGGLGAAVEAGRFDAVLAFLRERIHRHGARHLTPDLMRQATGRELSADPLIAHLRRAHLP